jgi:hypothetical protein
VTIRNAAGETEFTGTAPASGVMQIPLTQGTVRPTEWIPEHSPTFMMGVRAKDQHVLYGVTPHTVTAMLSGVEVTASVTMTQRRSLALDVPAATSLLMRASASREWSWTRWRDRLSADVLT